MSLQVDNNIEDVALVDSPGDIGSDGFRAAFYNAASRRPVVDMAGPTRYAKAARLNSKRNLLFQSLQSGLPDAPPTTLSLYPSRPEYTEVTKASIEVIDPELAKIDVRRIRDILSDDLMGPSMLQAAQGFEIIGLNTKEARVLVKDPSCVGPTHVLALRERTVLTGPITKTQFQVTCIPIHSLVFAANCARCPPLPPSNERTTRTSNVREFTVPTVHIDNSYSGPLFSIFLEYLYCKSASSLLARLLHMPRNRLEVNIAPACAALVNATIPSLSQTLADLNTVRKIACAFGVYDDELWQILDWAYQTATMVMVRRSGRMGVHECMLSALEAFDEKNEPTGDVKVEER